MDSKNLKVKIAASETMAHLSGAIGFKLDAFWDLFWPQFQKTIDESSSYDPAINTLIVLRRLFRAKPDG